MPKQLSRRVFLQTAAAASGAVIIGFDPLSRTWVTEASASRKLLDNLPKLDGVMLYDDATRQAAAVDHGHIVHHLPAAVLRPGSVQDVVKMVRYANQHRLKIGMRGRAHSSQGNAQVEAGNFIDSRTLNAVKLVGADSADVEPGASWGHVCQVTLPKGLKPRVMPNSLELSVGGNLSNGGFGGGRGLNFGAVVDNALELDVVTGAGQLVTCSAQRQSELFNMVLAGLGQCAIIVRGRIRLVPAPTDQLHQTLRYDDLETFLSDLTRLCVEGHFDSVGGNLNNLRINVMKTYTPPNNPDFAAWEAGLKFKSKSEPSHGSYDLRLDTFVEGAMWERQSPERWWLLPHPDMVMMIPASAAKDFFARMMATPSDIAGARTFDVQPLNTRRFTRPLFRMPNEDVAFLLWLQRIAPPNDPAALSAMMAANRSLFERMTAVGGKCYTTHTALSLSQEDWKTHYGPDIWRRLSAAKKKYDPKNVLTPGPGIFDNRVGR